MQMEAIRSSETSVLIYAEPHTTQKPAGGGGTFFRNVGSRDIYATPYSAQKPADGDTFFRNVGSHNIYAAYIPPRSLQRGATRYFETSLLPTSMRCHIPPRSLQMETHSSETSVLATSTRRHTPPRT
jgi:hypothetical protein